MTTSRLTPRSRGLRQRGGAVDGWKVRRQHPVGPFVVDFACGTLRPLPLREIRYRHGNDQR